ncbi:MAG: ATP-binding protein [Termitinemataceae bacterium]|nr:MAG: ATP-binding protein [Termitinemataceae bacterium]
MTSVIEKALKKFDKISSEETKKILQMAESEINILKMALDSAATGFIVCDTKNILLFTSKGANRILDIADESVSKETVWNALSDKEISVFLKSALLQKERIDGREFFSEQRNIRRLLSISILPLVKATSITGSLIVLEDISEKRSQEIKLRRIENLANLTNVAAGVAHEIKNPLASISIYIQLAQKLLRKIKDISISSKDGEKFENYLFNVQEEVERLNKIVVDFLFAVRPLEFTLIKSNINTEITNAIEFLKPELKENKIKYKQNLKNDLPLVLLDRDHFKQSLLNLFKNAIEAMSGGGTLSVSTYEKDNNIKIVIADTGCGISEEDKAKIFEPYWTTKIKGTGLGLTMVFKIIKEHKGDISIQSEKGSGTSFEISLPIFQKEKSLPKPA